MQKYLCIITQKGYNSNMQSASTRAKILEFLRIEHTATVAEIARTLNLTGAAVRYHLAQLENEGKIEFSAVTRQDEPGRPAQIFRLSDSLRPNFLGGLSSALLEIQLSSVEPDKIEEIWIELARRIAGKDIVSTSLPRRLTEAVQELNRMNYRARWEAGAKGPRVLFHNCPYAAIWPRFPGLCQMDRRILERLTGREMIQTATMDFIGGGHPTCIFEGFSGSYPPTLQSS
jgi:predicted ArsR family transcriptional regulator